jgi:hypothetical protein
MRFFFLFYFILFSCSLFSQKRIKGKVVFQNEPMANVAVYINTTTLGTTTNNKGEFSLFVKSQQSELIISALGFETINYSLNLKTYTNPLKFILKEKVDVLDEIVIGDQKYDKKWNKNLEKFKKGFLGESKFAKKCKILNEKDLVFEYDKKNKVFEAYAKKPLIVENNSLGYKITIDLIEFKTHNSFMRYLGFSRFEKLEGNNRDEKKWSENREKAYNGSFSHFLKCVVQNKVIEEGFIVLQFKRNTNPKRPLVSDVVKLKSILKKSKKPIEYFRRLKTEKPKNAIDSAYLTLKKLRFPKNIDSIYNTNLSSLEIKSEKKEATFLDFRDNLEIIYTKEKEEFRYSKKISKNTNYTVNKKHQSSKIISLKNPSLISEDYRLVNPLNVSFEGYWIFERIAHTLPLEYKPNLTKQ